MNRKSLSTSSHFKIILLYIVYKAKNLTLGHLLLFDQQTRKAHCFPLFEHVSKNALRPSHVARTTYSMDIRYQCFMMFPCHLSQKLRARSHCAGPLNSGHYMDCCHATFGTTLDQPTAAGGSFAAG